MENKYDIFGSIVHVGDDVIIIKPGAYGFVNAKITGFTTTAAKVQYTELDGVPTNFITTHFVKGKMKNEYERFNARLDKFFTFNEVAKKETGVESEMGNVEE